MSRRCINFEAMSRSKLIANRHRLRARQDRSPAVACVRFSALFLAATLSCPQHDGEDQRRRSQQQVSASVSVQAADQARTVFKKVTGKDAPIKGASRLFVRGLH